MHATEAELGAVRPRLSSTVPTPWTAPSGTAPDPEPAEGFVPPPVAPPPGAMSFPQAARPPIVSTSATRTADCFMPRRTATDRPTLRAQRRTFSDCYRLRFNGPRDFSRAIPAVRDRTHHPSATSWGQPMLPCSRRLPQSDPDVARSPGLATAVHRRVCRQSSSLRRPTWPVRPPDTGSRSVSSTQVSSSATWRSGSTRAASSAMLGYTLRAPSPRARLGSRGRWQRCRPAVRPDWGAPGQRDARPGQRPLRSAARAARFPVRGSPRSPPRRSAASGSTMIATPCLPGGPGGLAGPADHAGRRACGSCASSLVEPPHRSPRSPSITRRSGSCRRFAMRCWRLFVPPVEHGVAQWYRARGVEADGAVVGVVVLSDATAVNRDPRSALADHRQSRTSAAASAQRVVPAGRPSTSSATGQETLQTRWPAANVAAGRFFASVGFVVTTDADGMVEARLDLAAASG